MMKARAADILKSNRNFYRAYYYALSFLLRCLGLFIKMDNKLILFNSFGGKKYDDSPKEIYEKMRQDERWRGFKLVWAFHSPEEIDIPDMRKIKTDTLTYFVTALKARAWVSNSAIERGLSFKKRKTYYLNTWHGTPIKKMGIDMNIGDSEGFRSLGKSNVDIMCAQGEYDVDVFSNAFEFPRERFLLSGLPRNDRLANVSDFDQTQKRKKLGIDANKKVILYAPTFRDYSKGENAENILIFPVNFRYWREQLGGNFVILFRAHYEVAKVVNLEADGNFVIDVSDYPVLNDLMIASDLLISDYSSIFFDYSILGRPMIAFTYDYEEYAQKRGVYFDIREELPFADNEEALIKLIQNFADESIAKSAIRFRERFVENYGNATALALSVIQKHIKNR
jgi:CDP-glycerol glycerophosphotransferase